MQKAAADARAMAMQKSEEQRLLSEVWQSGAAVQCPCKTNQKECGIWINSERVEKLSTLHKDWGLGSCSAGHQIVFQLVRLQNGRITFKNPKSTARKSTNQDEVISDYIKQHAGRVKVDKNKGELPLWHQHSCSSESGHEPSLLTQDNCAQNGEAGSTFVSPPHHSNQSVIQPLSAAPTVVKSQDRWLPPAVHPTKQQEQHFLDASAGQQQWAPGLPWTGPTQHLHSAHLQHEQAVMGQPGSYQVPHDPGCFDQFAEQPRLQHSDCEGARPVMSSVGRSGPDGSGVPDPIVDQEYEPSEDVLFVARFAGDCSDANSVEKLLRQVTTCLHCCVHKLSYSMHVGASSAAEKFKLGASVARSVDNAELAVLESFLVEQLGAYCKLVPEGARQIDKDCIHVNCLPLPPSAAPATGPTVVWIKPLRHVCSEACLRCKDEDPEWQPQQLGWLSCACHFLNLVAGTAFKFRLAPVDGKAIGAQMSVPSSLVFLYGEEQWQAKVRELQEDLDRMTSHVNKATALQWLVKLELAVYSGSIILATREKLPRAAASVLHGALSCLMGAVLLDPPATVDLLPARLTEQTPLLVTVLALEGEFSPAVRAEPGAGEYEGRGTELDGDAGRGKEADGAPPMLCRETSMAPALRRVRRQTDAQHSPSTISEELALAICRQLPAGSLMLLAGACKALHGLVTTSESLSAKVASCYDLFQGLHRINDPVKMAPVPPRDEKPEAALGGARQLIVEAFVGLQTDSNLQSETLHLAITYYDRCVSLRPNVGADRLVLLAASCLRVASKMVESPDRELRPFDLLWMCNIECTTMDVLAMETVVLSLLEYRLYCVTPAQGIATLRRFFEADADTEQLALYAVNLFLADPSSVGIDPLRSAAAAFSLALHTQYRSVPFDLIVWLAKASPCVVGRLSCQMQRLLLKDYLLANRDGVLTLCRERFSSSTGLFVAQRYPPRNPLLVRPASSNGGGSEGEGEDICWWCSSSKCVADLQLTCQCDRVDVDAGRGAEGTAALEFRWEPKDKDKAVWHRHFSAVAAGLPPPLQPLLGRVEGGPEPPTLTPLPVGPPHSSPAAPSPSPTPSPSPSPSRQGAGLRE